MTISSLIENISKIENSDLDRSVLRQLHYISRERIANDRVPTEVLHTLKDLFNGLSISFLVAFSIHPEKYLAKFEVNERSRIQDTVLRYHPALACYLIMYHAQDFKAGLWRYINEEVNNPDRYSSDAVVSIFEAFGIYFSDVSKSQFEAAANWLLNTAANSDPVMNPETMGYNRLFHKDYYKLLNWMEENGQFTQETYQKLIRCFYQFTSDIYSGFWTPSNESKNRLSKSCSEKAAIYSREWYFSELESNETTSEQYQQQLLGGYYTDHLLLLKGLELIEQEGLTKKELENTKYQSPLSKLNMAASAFIQMKDIDIEEHELVAKLKHFSEKTLLTALPYAGAARPAILLALSFDHMKPTLEEVYRKAGADSLSCLKEHEGPYNSANTRSGVFEASEILAIAKAKDKKAVKKIQGAYKGTRYKMTNAFKYIDAIYGIDKEKLEKTLIRFNQNSIKAYGLYPIESQEELRARYLKIKELSKGAEHFGQERTENTRAAAQAGLTNLAHVAGYLDSTRLEWAMEAEISQDLVAFEEVLEIGEYKVQLMLEGTSPKIKIFKKDKLLKSVPSKLRKTEIYQSLRATQDHVRGQSGRFRKTLEKMMCSCEPFKPEELQQLKGLQVLNIMLQRLIFQTESGQTGLYQGNGTHLKRRDGKLVEISGPVRIAHVFDLFESGTLPDWQKSIVDHQIVQPFKQAYRELYVVTPAEIAAGHTSRRFEGHVVDGGKASALLSHRYWRQYSSDVVEIFKYLPLSEARVELGVPDAGHYLSERDQVTVDALDFYSPDGRINMEDLHPIEFSEVMRDLDLVVSVAGINSDNIRWSTETTNSRINLIKNLFENLQIDRLTFEDHFVFIKGSLARYRIHLGSGVIHIVPGNYLCVVPDHSKKSEDYYLPFDETDRKATEIISKMFLLLDDENIKDATILAQIRRKNHSE